MARLPDSFDLWWRRAQRETEPERQVGWLLGALFTLDFWVLPQDPAAPVERVPAQAEIEGVGRCLIVYSDLSRAAELGAGPLLQLARAEAVAWCLAQQLGVVVNPGEFGFAIGHDALHRFQGEWEQRKVAPRFFEPGTATEEEDFWQEHGL